MKLSDNAETVLQKRYYINGEDWDGLCWRVANAIGKDDVSRKEYFDAINNLYFLPNSPTLMNAGTELNNLSACFVLPLDDSMDSIMDCAKSMAKVFKSGGGCGISLDKLREKDSSVGSTSGAASGVVSFMQLYDTVANTVKQGGKRRAAIISSLRVDHPEILDFIDCKTDLKKFNNMNISVAITDKFMKAVEKNQDYDLISPVNGVVGKLNAREVFMKIATNAHQSGEPGLLFIDTANKFNPIPQFGKYSTTNPCFAGHEKLLTKEYGYIDFKSLHEKHPDSSFHIINDLGFCETSTITKTGKKETVKLKLSNRETITCTKDHVFSSNGKSVRAKDMKGMILDNPIKESFSEYPAEHEFYGFIQGDGNLSRLKSESHLGLEVNIGKNDTDIIEYINSKHSTLPELVLEPGQRKIYLKNFNKDIEHVGFDGNILSERKMPAAFNTWNNVEKLAFIRGCYSANGSVIRGTRISYKSTCKDFLEQIAEFLLSEGIETYITTNKPTMVKFSKNKPTMVKFSNGEYLCKESYDLNITKIKSIVEFGMKIGFIQKYRQDALIDLISSRACHVTSIKDSGIQDVYDFTCENHWGVVNGFVVHNCGEVFLLPNEACNLLSLNLNKINDDNIDYYVRLAVRFLNDVIDCGKYPLPEIHEQVLLTRKIGLGIMGWADLLASKMIPYDSPKARHLADILSKQIHEIAHDESVMLAIKNNKYIDTTEGKRYNGTLLTIAPTGTISMIADVSSSIEPYFALAYTKNVMDGHSLKYINSILQSTLEKEGLWCSEVKAQIAKTGSIQNIDTIPQSIKDVFKTANEISVGGHVKMQAAFQKNIDNSISKSINLPNSATVEDVLHAYGLAYNLGIKGITVYRDGSRSNQVLTSPKSKIERCPECGSKEVSHESGCVTCRNCGWSKCSI